MDAQIAQREKPASKAKASYANYRQGHSNCKRPGASIPEDALLDENEFEKLRLSRCACCWLVEMGASSIDRVNPGIPSHKGNAQAHCMLCPYLMVQKPHGKPHGKHHLSSACPLPLPGGRVL